LEKLPQKRQSKSLRLKLHKQKWFNNLTYLDISECYLLDHMPKWICELSNLEVLKGFIAGSEDNKKQFCRLGDLSELRKLRKLSIKIAKHLDLQNFSGLKHLHFLSVLTVIWGVNKQSEETDDKKDSSDAMRVINDNSAEVAEQSRENTKDRHLKQRRNNDLVNVRNSGGEGERNNDSSKVRTISFPKNLEKLDIRCYPEAEAAELLNPTVLPNLKRLYIRGGNLTKIAKGSGWKVLEILRLRFLKDFEIDWYDLSDIFSKLEYVEYEQCRSLKRFPENRSPWDMKMDGYFSDAADGETLKTLLLFFQFFIHLYS
jgi:hypothetical protein